MSDQELLDRIAQGDQTALTELCDRYAELIRKQAQWIARQYNCLRPGSHGGWSDYTKETLSELGLVRKAQMLYHRDGKEMSEIAGELGVSLAEVARAVAYPTHFFSVYDLPIPEEDGDIFEYLMSDRLSASAEEIVLRALTMKSLREQFRSLSKRERDILGRSFGALGYTKTDLREIAIRNRLREDGVEKAKKQALKKLRERCMNSMAWKLRRASRMVDRAISLEQLP